MTANEIFATRSACLEARLPHVVNMRAQAVNVKPHLALSACDEARSLSMLCSGNVMSTSGTTSPVGNVRPQKATGKRSPSHPVNTREARFERCHKQTV